MSSLFIWLGLVLAWWTEPKTIGTCKSVRTEKKGPKPSPLDFLPKGRAPEPGSQEPWLSQVPAEKVVSHSQAHCFACSMGLVRVAACRFIGRVRWDDGHVKRHSCSTRGHHTTCVDAVGISMLSFSGHSCSWSPQKELKVKVAQSCLLLCSSTDCTVLDSPWNAPGQNSRQGSLSLLQGIFPTQGLNPGLPHCRQILNQLTHKGSPRILDGEPSPLQWMFPTQESNQGFLHCRWILYQLRYQGSPRKNSGRPHSASEAAQPQRKSEAPVSIGRRMDKEVVVHIHNGILLNYKKECI